MGRLSAIGFDDRMSAMVESLSHDIIASSEIEGVELDNGQVRSSVARKLGVPLQQFRPLYSNAGRALTHPLGEGLPGLPATLPKGF